MKKHLIYLCMASLLGVTACEDDFNKDNFKGLDDMTTPENVLDKDYTLTADDYTTISGLKVDGIESDDLKAVKTDQYLSPATNPRVVLPAFLAKNWKTASQEATFRLTFNYVPNAPAYLSRLEAAETYELTAEDYQAIWEKDNIGYLTPEKSPEKNLPGILQETITHPAKGKYAVATYQYSENEPEAGGNQGGQPVELLAESFAGGQGAFTVENPVLPAELSFVWKADTQYGYMKASARKNNVNYTSESWLISPAMDMSGIATATLTFDHVARYGLADHSDVTLWVSTDYVSGAPSTAQWTQVVIPNYSSGADWTLVASGDIILDDFAGNANVRFAFRYTSTPDKTATWEVNNVVVNAVTGSASGDITYEEGEAFAESFAEGQGNFTVDNKVLPAELSYVWNADTKYGYMKASARKNNIDYASESWLISPSVSLAGVKEPKLNFDHVTRFGDFQNDLSLWVSVDGGNFVSLTIPAYSSGSDWNFVNSGDIDLSAYAGKTIKLGFKYKSDTTGAATWEVKNVSITGMIASSRAAASGVRPAAAGRIETRYAVYAYDGKKWGEAEKVTIVNPADYEEMGAPNKGYFTSSVPAADYLPQFLHLKYPYAQESDTLMVVYHYSNKTTLKADEYVFAGGVWKYNTQPVTAVTEQYALAEDGWVYSPDVTITLTPGRNAGTGHFQALTDWVWENIDKKEGAAEKGDGYVTSYGNNDYYYGGSEYQNNFDFRPSKWKEQMNEAYGKMSDEELTELMWERLPEGMQHMLEAMYPDAQLTDVPVHYVLKFGVYGIEGSSATKYYSIRFKLTGKGEFSYVENSLKEISSL